MGFYGDCAIAIRAASEVFVIYGCGNPARWIIKRLNCEKKNQYLEIYERRKEYEVILPTGTRVLIKIQGNKRLITHIIDSSGDWEHTEGLCGSFNGNQSDDLTDRDGNDQSVSNSLQRWMVPRSQSLFVARSRNEKLNTQVMYCSCFETSMVWDTDNQLSEYADCGWKDSLPLCAPLNFKENKCKYAGKREAIDEIEFDVPYDVVDYSEGSTDFSWKNGWTEGKAKNACISFATKSKLYQACKKITHSKLDSDLDICIADIKISGSDIFLSSSLDFIKSSCINEIRVNTTFWKKKESEQKLTTTSSSSTSRTVVTKKESDSELESVLEIAEAIYDLNCPSDCSNAGTCNQGVCECHPGFSGEDCSVDMRIPSELFGLSRESLCDINKRPCLTVSLFGKEFYESEAIVCRITYAQLQGEEILPTDFNMTVNGYLETFAEIKCPLGEVVMQMNASLDVPVFNIYLIAISLDLVDFSNQSPIVIYDAKCTECQVNKEGTLQCKTKKEICEIGNKCYDITDEICHPRTNLASNNVELP